MVVRDAGRPIQNRGAAHDFALTDIAACSGVWRARSWRKGGRFGANASVKEPLLKRLDQPFTERLSP
jgi:hypothetical protein